MKSDQDYYVEFKNLLVQQQARFLAVRERQIERLCNFLQEHKPEVYAAAIRDSVDACELYLSDLDHETCYKIHPIRRVDFMSKEELLDTVHELRPFIKTNVALALGVTNENFEIMSVTGKSMIEDDIIPGDKVVIQKNVAAINNDATIVVEVENKRMIKRYRRTDDGIELHSAASGIPPMFINNVDEAVKIHGLVIAVIKPK